VPSSPGSGRGPRTLESLSLTGQIWPTTKPACTSTDVTIRSTCADDRFGRSVASCGGSFCSGLHSPKGLHSRPRRTRGVWSLPRYVRRMTGAVARGRALGYSRETSQARSVQLATDLRVLRASGVARDGLCAILGPHVLEGQVFADAGSGGLCCLLTDCCLPSIRLLQGVQSGFGHFIRDEFEPLVKAQPDLRAELQFTAPGVKLPQNHLDSIGRQTRSATSNR
jgi:hypothetical protein